MGRFFMIVGIFFGIGFAVSFGLLGASMAFGMIATIWHPNINLLLFIPLPWMGIILGCEIAGGCFFFLGLFLKEAGY